MPAGCCDHDRQVLGRQAPRVRTWVMCLHLPDLTHDIILQSYSGRIISLAGWFDAQLPCQHVCMQDLRHQLHIVLIRICAGETTLESAYSDGACMQAASYRKSDGRSAGESSHKLQHTKCQEHGHQSPYLHRPHCYMLACFTLLSSFRRQGLQSCEDCRGTKLLHAMWQPGCQVWQHASAVQGPRSSKCQQQQKLAQVRPNILELQLQATRGVEPHYLESYRTALQVRSTGRAGHVRLLGGVNASPEWQSHRCLISSSCRNHSSGAVAAAEIRQGSGGPVMKSGRCHLQCKYICRVLNLLLHAGCHADAFHPQRHPPGACTGPCPKQSPTLAGHACC